MGKRATKFGCLFAFVIKKINRRIDENDSKATQKTALRNLTLAQRQSAEILGTNDVHQMTMAQVAERVGVSERTLYRWKQDRDFIRYQNEIAEASMEDFLTEAYNILKGLTRKGRSEHVKIKALELVLKNRGKLTDVQKIEATVEDLRSNENIEADIEELQKELDEIERTIRKDREAQ